MATIETVSDLSVVHAHTQPVDSDAKEIQKESAQAQLADQVQENKIIVKEISGLSFWI